MRISANKGRWANGPSTTRKWLTGLAAVAVLLGIGSSTAYAQFTCTANSVVPQINRAEGEAELEGDYVLTCTGGVSTPSGLPIPQVNITLSLNTTINSIKVGSGNVSEALLLIDEPFPNNNVVPAGDQAGEGQTVGQLGCLANNVTNCAMNSLGSGVGSSGSYNGTPGQYNVFQGVQTSPNTITWTGVPLDAPGDNIRIVRITNIRANAAQLGPGAGDMPNVIQATIGITGSESVLITTPEQVVGEVITGLGSSLAPGPGSFPACSGGGGTFTVSAAEQFSTAFLVQNYNQTITPFDDTYSPDDTSSNANQNVPGFSYGTESGLRLDSFARGRDVCRSGRKRRARNPRHSAPTHLDGRRGGERELVGAELCLLDRQLWIR